MIEHAMSSDAPATIGIDISKDTLDAHRLPDGRHRRLSNDPAGHRALASWIGTSAVVRVVHEPTGAYHRAMEEALDRAGLPLCRVNPRQARRFAEAAGQLAKTDRIDAEVLARMGEALALGARPIASGRMTDLRELLTARRALSKDRTAALNRQKRLTVPLLKRQTAQRLKQIGAQMAAVERAMRALVAEDPALVRRFDILVSIPGIAEHAAFSLLVDLPELGTIDPKQAASLAGLAPRTRQSGRWAGRAYVRGGRERLRTALYMPALVASRFNPDLIETYRRLVQAGKPAEIAITAVMRKLIVLANALLKADRTWSPRPA